MGRNQRKRKLARVRKEKAVQPKETPRVTEALRDVLISHPVCHDEGFVMGGPQRPDIWIGPGSGPPRGWRA